MSSDFLKLKSSFFLFSLLIFQYGSRVCEGVNKQSIEFFFEPYNNMTGACSDNSSYPHFGLTGVKVPDIQSLQFLVEANISTIEQYSINGIWALTSEVNYTGSSWYLVAPGGCTSFSCDESIDCQIKSLRYLGNPDADLPGLSLLPGDGSWHSIAGEEAYFGDSVEDINPPLCVSYWALSGNENWTLYSRPNFTGDAVCVTSNYDESDGFPGYGFNSLDYSSVRSVRRGGCFTPNILTHDDSGTNTIFNPNGKSTRTYFNSRNNDNNNINAVRNINNKLVSCKDAWETTTSTETTTKKGAGNSIGGTQTWFFVLILAALTTFKLQ